MKDMADRTISIDQSVYMQRILQRFNMENCNVASSLLEPGQRISEEMCAKTKREKTSVRDVP